MSSLSCKNKAEEPEYTAQQLRIKQIELLLSHPVALEHKWRRKLVTELAKAAYEGLES